MIDVSLWTLMTDTCERSLLPAECAHAIRLAAAAEWGYITLQRETAEKVVLRFDAAFGFSEHWASDDGAVSGARLPNRRPVTEFPLNLQYYGCGISLEVPDGYVLHKIDAVQLLLQFVVNGLLPSELAEPRGADQPVLPGMEKFVVPKVVFNAVQWEPL